MEKYVFLDHPADLKIKSFGKTRQELFLNMLLGVSDFQRAEGEPGKNYIERKIEVSSADAKSLLVDFLNECLYLSSVNREVYGSADFKKFTAIRLRGRLNGKKADGFGREIKAATYHDLSVRRRENGLWEAVVLFDV